MGQIFETISDRLAAWIGEQPMFFVGTAPSGISGHVNVSPKGTRDSFTILGPRQVSYIDMTGSGAETIAHLRDNGRIVIMFCAFAGAPKIVRLHGQGRVVLASDPGFAALDAAFPANPDMRRLARAIILVDVDRIADSCGYTVPRMTMVEERQQLFRWAEAQDAKTGDGWLDEYRATRNARSIDGLPALDPAPSPVESPTTTRRQPAARSIPGAGR